MKPSLSIREENNDKEYLSSCRAWPVCLEPVIIMHKMEVIKVSTIVIIESNILYILRSTVSFIISPINYNTATSH